MHLKENKVASNFNKKAIQNILLQENKFISDLFAILPIPVSARNGVDEVNLPKIGQKHVKQPKNSRAQSLVELQARLEALRSKKLTYKEKLSKKGIKNKIKKKIKKTTRKIKQATSTHLPSNESTTEDSKPAEAENTVAFSKFDFPAENKKRMKQEKDPKKLLEKLNVRKERLEKLKASGETEKVAQIKEKDGWKNALAKADGQKVRDDPDLLKKSLKKQEQRQRKSKKKWEARQETVKKTKEERQRKRSDNIEKRKKEKNLQKKKKAVKKGRIFPGF